MMMINRRRACGGKSLPYDAEIEYLEYTGTQYIDTKFKANTTTTRFECKFNPGSTSATRGVFGSRNAGSAAYYSCNIFIIDGYIRADWYSGSASDASFSINKNDVCNLIITRGYIVVNGTTYTNSNTDSINQNYNFLIGTFTNGDGNPYWAKFTGKWYYAKLFSNDVLVFDGIPVRVGNVGYMYDKVSGQLFGNSGTGDFILGPDKGAVTQPIIDMGLPSGTLWAQGNIIKDANGNYAIGEPTDYGCYFSWGNIDGHNEGEGYNFNSDNYALTPGSQLTGDISSDDAEHDAAVARIGGGFHLPSGNQMMELFNSEYTTNEWTTLNGVNGRRVTSLINGNSIFFPAAGYYKEESLRIRGSNCSSWSSRRSGLEYAYRLSFSGGGVNPQNSTDKYLGLSVRAVLNV